MDCKEVQDKLDAYLLGALDKAETTQLEVHLAGCTQQCRQSLKDTMRTLDVWRALPGIEPRAAYAAPILASWKYSRKVFRLAVLTIFVLLVALLCLMWPLWGYRPQYPMYYFALLEKAILQYNIQHRTFPDNDLSHLLLSGKNGGPYLSPQIFKSNGKGEILDMWGMAYRYRYPGIHNRFMFDIYSCGKNRIDEQGAGDDITNWKK
jgi:hypothetical protein